MYRKNQHCRTAVRNVLYFYRNTAGLPSGTSFTFTGTKVLSHLGSQGMFYARGIKPDVYVEETVEDIRNGNDAVLSKALSLIGSGQ